MLFNRLFACVDWIGRVTVMLMRGGGCFDKNISPKSSWECDDCQYYQTKSRRRQWVPHQSVFKLCHTACHSIAPPRVRRLQPGPKKKKWRLRLLVMVTDSLPSITPRHRHCWRRRQFEPSRLTQTSSSCKNSRCELKKTPFPGSPALGVLGWWWWWGGRYTRLTHICQVSHGCLASLSAPTQRNYLLGVTVHPHATFLPPLWHLQLRVYVLRISTGWAVVLWEV